MTVGFRAFLLQSPGQRRQVWLALLAALALCLLAFPSVSVAAPTVLYSFTAPTSPSASPATNSDGIAPDSKLVLGSDGNLYGTTRSGGACGAGSIFRVTPAGSLSNLYSFPAAANNSGEVVYNLGPNDLTQGTDGNFYGTTRSGGSNFTGTVFVVSPTGAFTNLHTFAAESNNASGVETSAAGATPVGALAQGSDGNFYGTTQYGGANGTGTIFQITPVGAFTSLHSFSRPASGSATTNGTVPNALTLGSDGAFYGTTQQGGVDNAGTFFKFTLAGGFTQIYSFNGEAPGGNPITPDSTLVQGPNGNFFGTSAFGGSQGGGSIFEITNTGGANVLYSFSLLNAGATAALTLGADGNFYGTTAANGLNGEGTFFSITPTGDFGAYSFSPLNTNSANADGANPSAAPTADSAGNIYGTCAAGGTNGSGVIFTITDSLFAPPFFVAGSKPTPAQTNALAGSSITLSHPAQGGAPLSYQWLRNGTNSLTDGGDLSGSATSTLIISPVFFRDVGSYALVISNAWGALTSSVTVLTVKPPGVSITSPKPNARTNSTVFAGTATNAPLFPGTDSGDVRLTGVNWSITSLLNGSIITNVAGVAAGSGGASNWSFTATPYPGTNILSVRSVDVSGDVSPVVSRTFFYEMQSKLTVLTTGSGTGSFSIANGAKLNVGESYSITARPSSSVFSNWVSSNVAGSLVIGYDPTFAFVMQSNLVLTADFISRQPPAIFISTPKAKERTGSNVFEGTAACAPVLPGVNPDNVRLTNVQFWLTNDATGSVETSGFAALTSGAGVSNWSITVTPAAGTNTLAVQCSDVSGGVSRIESRTFFYKKPALFALTNLGNGTGTFTYTASVARDTPPTNGAMLNIGEGYTITAQPHPFSTFSKWGGSASTSQRDLSFIMQPGYALTATFVETPPKVTISSPTANLRAAATNIVFKGAASGHFPISNVFCSLSDTNGIAKLTAGAGNVSDWSIDFVPSPGFNTLTVSCEDVNSNYSTTVTRKFFSEVRSRLSVTNAGLGHGNFRGAASVAGNIVPADGAMLNIGEGYTITAIPDKFSLFSNWVGTADNNSVAGSDTPKLSFVMQSNLVLTVTFVTNFFPPAAGKYNGLFFPATAVSRETSGMLYNLVLRDTGAFSGRLLIAGTNYPFATNFNASSNATLAAGPLELALTLDTAIPQITGTVSSNFTSYLTADRASDFLPSAEYTILFSPSTSNAPPGNGYALVTNRAGIVTLSGALADGTRYNQAVPVSRSGDVPVYASLYTQNGDTHPGVLMGWINLTNLQAAAPSNTLAWIKKPYPTPALYTNGFTNLLTTQGALWLNPPAKTSAISLNGGEMVISNTGLFLDFTNVVVSDNKLTNSGDVPTNSLSGVINPKTGLLTLIFANGSRPATNSSGHVISGKSHETTAANGAIIQNTTNAGGYFLAQTNAGSFNLQP